jgi:hypothetical protein
MSSSSYTLEVVSNHPEFRNRSMRKYRIEGIDTIGVWGNEPFEIRFRNHTWQKVQVKISLDGTDILTGEPATTNVSNKMWVVNGYGTLNIQAWPESNNGGARFVFTHANNSVALNTHGDMSSRGIIAAAVFVEGHVEPVRVDHHHHYYNPYNPYYFSTSEIRLNGRDSRDFLRRSVRTLSSSNTKGFSKCAESFSVNNCSAAPSASLDFAPQSLDCDLSENEPVGELKSLASVGAGEYVNQKISYVQGLIKPTFNETVRVRYLWWDDLKVKLEQGLCVEAQASGFPGDKNEGFIKLGKTPRTESAAALNKGFVKRIVSEDAFTRF